MIFLFGTRGKAILTEKLNITECGYCHEHDTIYATVVTRYFHFFWIPIFPFSKTVVTVCSHCKETLREYQIRPEYRNAIGDLKSKAKFPIWQFTGLIFISLPVLLVIFSSLFRH